MNLWITPVDKIAAKLIFAIEMKKSDILMIENKLKSTQADIDQVEQKTHFWYNNIRMLKNHAIIVNIVAYKQAKFAIQQLSTRRLECLQQMERLGADKNKVQDSLELLIVQLENNKNKILEFRLGSR